MGVFDRWRTWRSGAHRYRSSTRGGQRPGWSPDGSQVLFLSTESGDERMLMAVDMPVEGDKIRPGLPEPLFAFPAFYRSRWYGGAADGRILAQRRAVADHREALLPKVVVNWSDELAAKIPETR